MRKKSKFETIKELAWAYAIVNGRLGEVYFEKSEGAKGIFAHAYLDKTCISWNKKDKQLMRKDVKHHRFTYRKRKYYPTKSNI